MIVTNTIKWNLLWADMLIKQQTAGYLAGLYGGGKRGLFHPFLTFAIPLPCTLLTSCNVPRKSGCTAERKHLARKWPRLQKPRTRHLPAQFLEPSPLQPSQHHPKCPLHSLPCCSLGICPVFAWFLPFLHATTSSFYHQDLFFL